MLIPVLEKRRFDFGYLAGGASQLVTLQPAIDVCGFYHVQLWVRVHTRSMTSGQSFVLELFNTLPCDNDPTEFTETSALTDVTITSGAPGVVPALVYRDASSPGPFLKLVLTATQTSVPSSFYVEASAALVVRAA